MTFNPGDLMGVLPALILMLGGLLVLTSEVFLRGVFPGGKDAMATPPPDRRYQAFLAALVSALALAVAISQLPLPAVSLFSGAATADGFGRVVAAVVSLSLLLSCLVSFGYLEALNATRGEFYALALFAASGMCLLAQATDLIVLFIALEVMSLSVYSLTAYLRRGKRPAEAAFKYFVLGSFASAIYLYGAALAFGATGSTRIAELATAVRAMGAGQATSGLLMAGGALLAAGFFFKVAAVPFHMWVPDVYEGAPAPVTGFMAAGVKAAGFAALVRILISGYGDPGAALGPNGWQPVLVVLAGLTMLVGNVLAVPQRSVKRMLAYSSIAHAGYLLVAVASMASSTPRAQAVEGLAFYLLAYAITVVGAFGVVALIERRLALTDKSDELTNWAGLSEKHPLLAAAMALFMLSLAGVPPTAGFMAKLTIFRSAISADLTGLAIFGVLASAVGLYYYLRVVVYLYMQPATDPVPVQGEKLFTAGLALAGCALLVLWFGVQPGTFTSATYAALSQFGR